MFSEVKGDVVDFCNDEAEKYRLNSIKIILA